MRIQIVASPVIGRVVVVGSDRTIGTVAGGVTGWLCFMAAYQMTRSHYLWQYAVLCLMVTVFAWASVIVGWWAARLETTPKLFTLTFVLVAFSAKDMTSENRMQHQSFPPFSLRGLRSAVGSWSADPHVRHDHHR